MKLKKSFIIIFFVLILFLISPKCFANTWKSLDYDAKILSNGDMEVIETWNVYISETNTLFKDFNVDREKFSEITNVKVARMINGEENFLNQIFVVQDHVDSGCYYGLTIKGGSKFEIAWNVGLDNSSENRTYKVYYTVKDVVREYNDCTELYWQFLGDENNVSVKNITGKITLPKSVSDIEKLRVWAHGPLSGTITRESTNTVKFNLPSLDSNTMLEIRVVTEEPICDIDKINTNKLESILSEEEIWANEANIERKKQNIIRLIFLCVAALTNFTGGIALIYQAYKYYKAGKEIPKDDKYKTDLEYFRDIPDEKNATPAYAMFLYNFRKSTGSLDVSKAFSATMLDLCIKQYIDLTMPDGKNVEIQVKKYDSSEELLEDEERIFSLVKKCCRYYDKNSISVKEFTKYAKREYEEFYDLNKHLTSIVKDRNNSSDNIDRNKETILKKWTQKYGIYLALLLCTIAFIVFIPAIYIGLLVCFIICLKNASKIKSTLSEKGFEEQAQWKGLKKYMNDYSLLKEKSVPDIVLWEKYLVYATAFGIAEKVLKEIKVQFPEYFQEDYYGRYGYFNTVSYGGFDRFERSITSAYRSAVSTYQANNYSSGSGSGGGFSGGGGGRRRRRRYAEAVK